MNKIIKLNQKETNVIFGGSEKVIVMVKLPLLLGIVTGTGDMIYRKNKGKNIPWYYPCALFIATLVTTAMSVASIRKNRLLHANLVIEIADLVKLGSENITPLDSASN